MLTSIDVWLLTRGDAIIKVSNDLVGPFGSIAFLGLITCLVLTGIRCFMPKNERKGVNFKIPLLICWSLEIFLFFFVMFFNFAQMLVPTKSEMAAIILLPKLANNENINKIPSNIADLANEWINELKPKNTMLTTK